MNKKKKDISIKDISNPDISQLAVLDIENDIQLPPPYDKLEDLPGFKKLNEQHKKDYDASLDGVLAVNFKQPETEEEEKELVEKFLHGLKKLFSKENNWTFLQPLILSMEHCAQCQTCNEDCNVYQATHDEIYRPNYRAEVLRRLYFKYIKPGNSIMKKFQHGDIELNWTLISRLIELSYRCTLCRRCAQSCPIGVDNGLIAHELRKLFSQEMEIAPKELHEKGTVQQLAVGSSTGMTPEVVKDNVEFIDEEMSEKFGIEVKTRWDEAGADIMLIHNAGEFMAWPENPAAFTIMLEAAGYSWTLSSEPVGYDGVNYGLFYDDVQLAKVMLKHLEVAKKLGVKRIVMGECGHETKVIGVIGDRLNVEGIRVESALTLMEEITFSGKLKLDPMRNNFPVTLHDPCNIVRNLGIVEPQRRVLRYLAPQFREMAPHGVRNYCCGGGSGFAIMSSNNFTDWRMHVSGKRKFAQILDAFKDEDLFSNEVPKYICAPCSNCKGQFRDILEYYGATKKSGIFYGGLVELIVNAMVDLPKPYLDFEEMMFM